jgi:hypothetical protein
MRPTSSDRVTSAGRASAWSIVAAVSARPASLTSTRATRAPAWASTKAQRRPSPDAAPVTRAFLPRSEKRLSRYDTIGPPFRVGVAQPELRLRGMPARRDHQPWRPSGNPGGYPWLVPMVLRIAFRVRLCRLGTTGRTKIRWCNALVRACRAGLRCAVQKFCTEPAQPLHYTIKPSNGCTAVTFAR